MLRKIIKIIKTLLGHEVPGSVPRKEKPGTKARTEHRDGRRHHSLDQTQSRPGNLEGAVSTTQAPPQVPETAASTAPPDPSAAIKENETQGKSPPKESQTPDEESGRLGPFQEDRSENPKTGKERPKVTIETESEPRNTDDVPSQKLDSETPKENTKIEGADEQSESESPTLSSSPGQSSENDSPSPSVGQTEHQADGETGQDTQTSAETNADGVSGTGSEPEHQKSRTAKDETSEKLSHAKRDAGVEHDSSEVVDRLPQTDSPTACVKDPDPRKSDSKAKQGTDTEPRDIGSRRKDSADKSIKTPEHPDSPPPTAKPALVCREDRASGYWEIFLSASPECQIKQVRQNNATLQEEDGEYRLNHYSGHLNVECADGDKDNFHIFDDAKPLIFKLGKNWTGDGRAIDGITRGCFIVIAPREWNRTGQIPVEPATCSDRKFQAHYFYRDRDQDDGGGFKECLASLTKSGFDLRGHKVFDNSDQGDLFVGEPPAIETASDIERGRVGEEKKDGWKGENFKLADEKSLAKALNGRQGRFFIRVYRKGETRLADSGEFRYFANLREIRINGRPYADEVFIAPHPKQGHQVAKLEFLAREGSRIRPSPVANNPYAESSDDGAVTITPHPDADETTWSLPYKDGSVDIAINLPRIWWRIVYADGDSGEWLDKPISMSRDEFREAGEDQEACLEIRRPVFIKKLDTGFNDDLTRRYSAQGQRHESCYIRLPLEDFVYDDEIDSPSYRDNYLQIRCTDTDIPVVRVIADPMPRIISFTAEPATIARGKTAMLRWRTENSETASVTISPNVGAVDANGNIEVPLTETTTFTLRIAVEGMVDLTESVKVRVPPLPTPPDHEDDSSPGRTKPTELDAPKERKQCPRKPRPTVSPVANNQAPKTKTRIGTVISDNMDKTVVVRYEWSRRHSIYKKKVRRRTKFYAHDENNRCQLGDTVRIVESRPFSKKKRWRVAKILSRVDVAEMRPEKVEIDEDTLIYGRAR